MKIRDIAGMYAQLYGGPEGDYIQAARYALTVQRDSIMGADDPLAAAREVVDRAMGEVASARGGMRVHEPAEVARGDKTRGVAAPQ